MGNRPAQDRYGVRLTFLGLLADAPEQIVIAALAQKPAYALSAGPGAGAAIMVVIHAQFVLGRAALADYADAALR